MSYVVLARKYRPSKFEEVVGQGHVARTLMNAIEQDRLAHAFLFTGTRGVGKTTTARILAKAVNCRAADGPTPHPCDDCPSCTEITAGQAVDVFEIDGASNRGINEIRELRESVRYAPSRDRFKVYIIDEVHMLTTEAFNALLKTLEEPPPHAMFIFATTEPQKIPVTILSRCQRYDFKRIGQHDIVEHLQLLSEEEGIESDKAALQIVARQAAGGMRDALSLLDQIISFAGKKVTETQVAEVLGVANRRHLFDLSRALLARDAEAALLVLDDVNRYGYDLNQFASELVSHLRDLMVVKVVEDPERVTELTTTEIDEARQQVKDAPRSLLHRYFEVMAQSTQEMARTSYPKLIFEMALVRLTQLEPLVGIDLLVERLAELEGVLDDVDAEPLQMSGEEDGRGEGAPKPERRSPEEPGSPVDKRPEPPKPGTKPAQPHVDEPTSPVDRRPKGDTPAAPTPPSEVGEGEEEGASDDEPAPAPAPEPEPDQKAAQPALTIEEVDDVEELEEEGLVLEPLSSIEIDALSPTDRWRKVVAALRSHRSTEPLAATCEHAYVERFEANRIELTFEDRYLDIIREGDRLATVQGIARQLFGMSWSIRTDARRDDTDAAPNLADERDAEIRKRKSDLEDALRNNPAVQQASELFGVPSDEIRYQVQLHDEG